MLKSELEIFKEKVKEGFAKIKSDFSGQSKEIARIKDESLEIKKDYVKIKELLFSLKKDMEEIKEYAGVKANDRKKGSKQKKNSKILVLNRIFNILSSGKTKTNELKNQVVEVEKLCSKASFYRYVDELIEKNKVVGVKSNEGAFLILNSLEEQKNEDV